MKKNEAELETETESKNLDMLDLARNVGIKIERISSLMDVLERGIDEEYDIEEKKLASIAYIISDYISDLRKEFSILETKIEFNK